MKQSTNSKLDQIRRIREQKAQAANLKKIKQSNEHTTMKGEGRSCLEDLDENSLLIESQENKNAKDVLKFEDEFEDEFEKEIMEDEDAEDNSSDFESVEEEDGQKKLYKKEPRLKEAPVKPFLGTEKHLQTDEYLDYDNTAYTMLHRADSEWPCLSFDWLSGKT